jgi:hypothetical protein
MNQELSSNFCRVPCFSLSLLTSSSWMQFSVPLYVLTTTPTTMIVLVLKPTVNLIASVQSRGLYQSRVSQLFRSAASDSVTLVHVSMPQFRPLNKVIQLSTYLIKHHAMKKCAWR